MDGFADPSILGRESGYWKVFGNRQETYDDYNSAQLLILMLCDIVSRGGNFLLDIGPTADGRIPVIMEDRLIKLVSGWMLMGKPYLALADGKDCQWSEGDIAGIQNEFHHGVPDPILEMAIKPKPDKLVKSVILQKKTTLYTH